MKFRSPYLIAAGAALLFPNLSAAATVTVTGITSTGAGGIRIEIPTIEAEDSSLDEAGIRALFAGPDYGGLLAGLADLDAAAIRIPEISMRYDLPAANGGAAGEAEIIYRDFEMNDVADGIAHGARLGSTEIRSAEDMTITLGTMTLDLLDIGAILGFYGIGSAGGGEEMKPLYENFRMDGASVASPAFNCDIGPAVAERFSARPISGSFDELMKLTAEFEQAETSGEPPSPEAISAFVAFYADFLRAFESTPTTLDGLECTGTESGKPVHIGAGALLVGGFSPGVYPEIAVDDFRLEIAGDGWFEFGNFTWKRTDLNGPIDALLAARQTLTEDWFEKNWRSVIPAIEGFSLEGLAFDVPDADNPGSRSSMSIGALDLTLSEYRDGIPAHVSTNGSNIVFDVPAAEKELRSLGYEQLDLGYDLAARWDEPNEEIVVERFMMTGAGMGTVTLSGIVGNAGSDLFALDEKVSMRAAAGLTVKELTIDIENGGLAPALIAMMAREEGQEPQEFHVALTGLARALPLAVLGGTPEAVELSNALGSFLGGAPNLRVTLTSVDPAGIGLNDLAAAENDPAALKGKVTIAAEASGEPVPFVWPEVEEQRQPPPPPPAAPRS